MKRAVARSWPAGDVMAATRPSAARQRLVELLARHLFSSLAGVATPDWLRLLWANDFAVDPVYLPRALLLSVTGVPTAVDRWREARRFGPAVAAARVPPPVFVLGHWRTGTTHLHNLLAADPRLAYPNLYEVFNPHTFLLNEDWLAGLVAAWLPERRLMDRVRLGVQTPQEDEFALTILTGLSPYLGWVFPRRRAEYDKYLTFRNVPAADRERWKAGFDLFARKLAVRYPGRPVVFKSPPHTARVRLLLELFPDARFVHIARDPYAVFQSTRHFERSAAPAMALQRAGGDPDARMLSRYSELYRAYLADRTLIPPGRLCEVRYEELAADPLGVVGTVYDRLGLPDFAAARPAVEAYLGTVGGYRTNDYAPLPAADRRAVAAAWGEFFDAWGYPA